MTFFSLFDSPEGRAFARSNAGRKLVDELKGSLDHKANAMMEACKVSGNAKCMQAAYEYENAKNVAAALIFARTVQDDEKSVG